MVKYFVPFATSAALAIAAATAVSLPDGTWPASTGTVQYSEAYTVKAGEVFDGKMQTFERSDISCEGQTESSASTAVFKLEPGATLKNVIIGKNQMEGVHCDKHDCTIENVWWDDVCEDALSVKGGTASSVTTVTGGGARYADDKVIQHNGYGTVQIDGFYGEDISKLYRSCGTCGDKARKVSVSNVYVVNPGNAVVTVNKNWNDEATLSNVWVKSSSKTVKICQWSQGNADGEPSILGNGPSPPLCQYSESDVHINEDISKATQTSTSSTSSSSDPTQTTSAASSASGAADPTQTASSASTTSSASTSSPSASSESASQVPTQDSSSSTESSLASSASSLASSNSSTDASEAAAPGTVTPIESGSFEQSVVTSDASQTQQQDSTEQPTELPSASSSSSSVGSVYSSSDDVTQTAVQQSSVASSSETDVSETDAPQTDVMLECDSNTGSTPEQTSRSSSVASSSSADSSQTNVVLASSSSSGMEEVEVPVQQSTSASAASSSTSNSGVESQQETTVPSASGSTTSSSSTTPTSSSSSSASAVDSPTQGSSASSPTQSSSTGSTVPTSGSDSTEQTASNTTVGVPDGTWPASTGTVLYSKPYTIKAGEVFDGKMQTFERSDITCSGGEGQKDTAVFLVEAGGTLKNAIIGKNQKEGVHCDDHDCTIENVWWDDVCEDALSIKGGSASSVTTVTNCGARYASDKVVQHNGYGTVKINGFFAQEFGKLYRSCGTCGNIARTVTVENVYAIDPLVSLVTVNKNYNDQATLKNIYVKTTDGKDDVKICQWSQGSKTPSNLGDGPSGKLCQYAESDVHINEE
ncbi:unnamed protein product [Phytophthora fragariaefolia]|uniref:Probable pectate lyase F n=1 Tax=Phytophthora fragariaefolia TaxID=1490495 RepID=A0A9W7CYV7_9STRA|nr:unnamed protein product [Phytophthora fragariaefolia]